MTASKTLFIDRANSATARAAFDGAAKTIRNERQNVFIFPEGTRSYTSKPDMLPFKKGAFHLAIQAGAPIVPVVVENYSWLLNVKERRFTSGTIHVTVLPPIETNGLAKEDIDRVMGKMRSDMLVELEAMYKERFGAAALGEGSATTTTASSTGVDVKRR